MANYETEIYELGQVQKALRSEITEKNQNDIFQWFSVGSGYYHNYFKQLKKINKKITLWPTSLVENHLVNTNNFKKFVSDAVEIQEIINFYSWLSNQDEGEGGRQSVKEETSVPPEIEGLVEEYRQNQARLNEKEVKSSGQRTVAEQVKIALAHSNIREQIMANRREREEAGEKFRDIDKTIVDLGSPKDGSVKNTLAPSYKAVQRIAFTYEGFEELSPHLQNQIISQAVELNTIGIIDLDVAIQTVSLQLGVKDISTSFVSEVVEEINDIELEIRDIEDKLSQNEAAIDILHSKATLSASEEKQLAELLKVNSSLTSSLNKTSTRFTDFVDSQSERYKQHTSAIADHQKKDQDLLEFSNAANDKVFKIQENLYDNAFKSKGIEPRGFSDLDKIAGLITVIQKDIPGIHQYASYEGAQAAAIIGGGQGQAILAYSKGVSGSVLRQAEKYATTNPNSATAKFLANNTKVFQAARRSIREIENSKLGKDVLQAVSKGNQIIGIVTNPVGSLKQWAGKKAGEQIAKRLVERFGSEALKNAPNLLLREGLKDGVKKLASQALSKAAVKVVTWAAVKLGISVTAESLNAIIPGLGVIVDVAIQAIIFVAEQTIGLAKKGLDNTWRELGWGDKFRSRDLIIPVVAAGAVAVTAGTTFIRGLIILRRSVQIAVISAIGIIIGAIIVVGLYVAISYLIAPILSTIVQFDSLSKVDYAEYGGGGGPGGGPGPGTEPGGGVYNLDCGEDSGAEIMVQAGSFPVVKKLLTGPGRSGYCIIPTKITIHWSGGWTNNDVTYNTLVERGLSCQIGTDQDGSVQQWQQMWEKKAELAYCVGGNENNYCLNNEMVGAWFIPPGTSPTKPEEKSPSEAEIQSSVNSTCFMMKQYHIPYTQIFGHYELRPGKNDPGVEFLDYFINRVKQQCP